MQILIVHNPYQQRGGEDAVVNEEAQLLTQRGHAVTLLTRHNDEISSMGRLSLGRQTLWSSESASVMVQQLQAARPDVVHVHNTLPLISPSVYWAAAAAGIPVVQTLHNFRLLCPQAMFLRKGRVCEDCLGHATWRGALRGCYRGSIAQSTVVSGMLTLHRALGTYRNKITRYIALNEFCRGKFIAGGLPRERVLIKPNFVDCPAPPVMPRAGFLFVGRLSAEKGVDTLARAVAAIAAPLRLAGTGPESGLLEGMAGTELLGALPAPAVYGEMARAMALVLPSVWYENFPRTLVEAYANGLPVIASRLGALAELVQDGVTGLLFTPGDAQDLAAKMQWALAHPAQMAAMGRNARARYEAEYTADRNYEQLMAIYRDAIAEVAAGRRPEHAAPLLPK